MGRILTRADRAVDLLWITFTRHVACFVSNVARLTISRILSRILSRVTTLAIAEASLPQEPSSCAYFIAQSRGAF